MNADRPQISKRQQARTHGAHNEWSAAANFVTQVTNKRNHQNRNNITHHRNPQINRFIETNAITRLNSVCSTKNSGHNRCHIHQRADHHANHVTPVFFNHLSHWRFRHFIVSRFFSKCRGFIHFFTDFITDNNHHKTHQKWNAPAP